MKWWRAGRARLGVRTAAGRDAVVAAAVVLLSLSRLVVFGGRAASGSDDSTREIGPVRPHHDVSKIRKLSPVEPI